ncbi:MAG: nitroreductase [Bacteroidetes bacterium]|nr:MAG: nitroreductase [Bacteroidota bacterium]
MAKIIRREQGENVQITDLGKAAPAGVLPFDASEATRLIRQRRSIFPEAFSGEPVSREDIELMLENAHWAPTHGRTEPWFFKVFTGEGLRRFGQAHATLYQQHTAPENFKQETFDKLAQRPTECSHLIVICMKRGENPKIPVMEEVEAVACAVQNLHLTATALGLAAYWGSGGMTYHPAMREWLGLGADDQCLGLFMVGKPKAAWPEGKRKADWRDKVEWNEA